jgi:hypothetical protein
MIVYNAAHQPRWPTLAWTFRELRLYATAGFVCGLGALVISAIGIGSDATPLLATALIVLMAVWLFYNSSRSRSDQISDRAAIHTTLGTLLLHQGELTKDPVVLRQAEAAFREALALRTREKAPLDWAATQSGLGTALLNLGHITSDAALLREAQTVFGAALEVCNGEPFHANMASTMPHHAIVEALEVLKQAEAASRQKLETQTRDGHGEQQERLNPTVSVDR